MHWAAEYIGKEWQPVGDGVNSFNCWTFLTLIQKKYYNRNVPDLTHVDASDVRAVAQACLDESGELHWRQVEKPEDGDVVLMSRTRFPVHVGIWINANDTSGVLHCQVGQGVVFQRPAALQASGWSKLQYFRWVE